MIAFNPYDYPGGLERGNWFARVIGTGVRLPGSGPVFARLENRAILRACCAAVSPTTTRCRRTCLPNYAEAAAGPATPG